MLIDSQTLEELTVVIARRADYDNRERRHSKIGYMTPLSYAETMRGPTVTARSGPINHVQLFGCTAQGGYRALERS